MLSSQRRPITRNRELLACTECRRRKLKCDRTVPCSSCVKRADEASCTYQRFARSERERERRIEAESRLEHLEGLVQQLAATQSGGGSDLVSQASSNQPGSSVPRAVTTESLELPYSGSTHWSAMLEDIEELRFSIAADDNQLEGLPADLTDDDGTGFLFGAAASLPYEQILSHYLPPRPEADRLVGTYFRSRSVVAPFIHTTQFRRRYQLFWNNPQESSPLWTSMLFCVLHIANTVVTLGNVRDTSNGRYLMAAAQCLATGKYYKPQPYAVEALLLFAQSKCFRGFDITSEMGVIMANVIRLATSSGYHRDPDIFNLSAFEKELRRRTWSLCIQLDMLIAFALGLPSNVPFSTHDTHAPRNLLDTDFDEETIELPPGRPDSEPTNIMFYITKHRLMAVFEKILQHSLSTAESSSAQLDDLEQELEKTYVGLPEVLKPKPVAESVVDSSNLVVTRLCVLFLYQKCRCVLHRKYAATGRAESSKICYEASSSIVGYFIDIFPDLQSNGQFEHERWFNSTLTWHDYLLGVMVLCLVLCVNVQGLNLSTVDYAVSTSLLRRAQEVCTQVSYKSRYTVRVQRLIQATLVRLGSDSDQGPLTSTINGHILPDIPTFSSLALDQASSGGVNIGSSNVIEAGGISQNGDVWSSAWSGPSPAPIDDISWQYLDQFLNLPNDDLDMDL